MKEFISSVISAGVVMGVVDIAWLSVVAKKFYDSQIGSLLLDKFNGAAAVAFYLIYIIGVTVFVILPALDKQSWQHAIIYGAAFGFVAYATYDLTNLATLKGFTTKLALVDMAWGTVLTATVATVSYFAVRVLIK